MMFKEKFKATLTDKDAATDIMYHTSWAMKLENDNFTTFILNDEKMMQKADLTEHQNIRFVIFWTKIIFKINEVIELAIDMFNSLNENLYITCKIMTKILMNWTFSICFDIKLHQVRSILDSMHVLISYTSHFTTFIFLQKSITNSIWL